MYSYAMRMHADRSKIQKHFLIKGYKRDCTSAEWGYNRKVYAHCKERKSRQTSVVVSTDVIRSQE